MMRALFLVAFCPVWYVILFGITHPWVPYPKKNDINFSKKLYLQNKNNLTGSGTDVGKSYIAFVQGNMTQIEKKIKDDLWVLSTMEVCAIKI